MTFDGIPPSRWMLPLARASSLPCVPPCAGDVVQELRVVTTRLDMLACTLFVDVPEWSASCSMAVRLHPSETPHPVPTDGNSRRMSRVGLVAYWARHVLAEFRAGLP